MGIFDNVKAFIHSITTEDHYASYDSPYKNSAVNGKNTIGGGGSSSRLHELNRLATVNSSSHSLIEGNGSGNGSRVSLSRNESSNAVGYRPGLRSSTNLNSSDLQLQNLNSTGQPPLPSIDSLWDRIESWLDDEYPELGDNLNDGVTTADLNELENDLGCGSLPVEVRQFYKRHDGQFRGGKPTGLIMGLTLLDLESVVEEYAIWAKVTQRLERQQQSIQYQQQTSKQPGTSASAAQAQQGLNSLTNTFMGHQKSIPPNSIQPVYSHRGWIPFAKDYCGNQVAVDVAPGPQGHWGQIIVFGRDFDTKLVVASNFQEFIFNFVNDLEQGKYQVDESEDKNAYGFLENSRNDDNFMIGDDEEGQGELSFYDVDGKEFGKNSRRKLSYFEVLKRRSLKKYGIINSEKFATSFTPQRVAKKQQSSRSSSPVVSQSGTMANASDKLKKSANPLINLDSSSKVSLPKETLIDDDKKADDILDKSEKTHVAHKSQLSLSAAAAAANDKDSVSQDTVKPPGGGEVKDEVATTMGGQDQKVNPRVEQAGEAGDKLSSAVKPEENTTQDEIDTTTNVASLEDASAKEPQDSNQTESKSPKKKKGKNAKKQQGKNETKDTDELKEVEL